jgi:hypothetical protein
MRAAARAEVSAANSVAAAPCRGMTPAGKMTAATATVTPTAATVTPAATMLRKRGRCPDQYRPQNAGREKQASALGTHDCHLPLPFAPLRKLLKPIKFRPYLYNAVQVVWCTAIAVLMYRTAT